MGDTITKLVTGVLHLSPELIVSQREFIIVAGTALVTLPISLYRDMARLGKISLASVAFIGFVLITIYIRMATMDV